MKRHYLVDAHPASRKEVKLEAIARDEKILKFRHEDFVNPSQVSENSHENETLSCVRGELLQQQQVESTRFFQEQKEQFAQVLKQQQELAQVEFLKQRQQLKEELEQVKKQQQQQQEQLDQQQQKEQQREEFLLQQQQEQQKQLDQLKQEQQKQLDQLKQQELQIGKLTVFSKRAVAVLRRFFLQMATEEIFQAVLKTPHLSRKNATGSHFLKWLEEVHNGNVLDEIQLNTRVVHLRPYCATLLQVRTQVGLLSQECHSGSMLEIASALTSAEECEGERALFKLIFEVDCNEVVEAPQNARFTKEFVLLAGVIGGKKLKKDRRAEAATTTPLALDSLENVNMFDSEW